MDKLGLYWPSYIYGKMRQYIQPYYNIDFDINHVYNNVYIGDFASACNLKKLKEYGITHIITVIRGVDAMFPNDFEYLLLDVGDNPNYNIKCYFDSTNNFIDKCVKNNGKVLVHCMYGVSRSATIVCAYLIKTLHIDTLTAYKLLKDKRDIVHPNEGFIRQLNDYYLSL